MGRVAVKVAHAASLLSKRAAHCVGNDAKCFRVSTDALHQNVEVNVDVNVLLGHLTFTVTL